MTRHLDRYILREILGPLGLGFLVYTFIMVLRMLFRFADLIVNRGVSVEIVGQLLMLSLPNIVVLTIPMSLLFGILTAIGRLSADSELVAMRSSGISLLSLYRPILLLSGLLAVVNVGLMTHTLPWGNSTFQRLYLEALSTSVSRQVEPRVFYDEWEPYTLYVFRQDPQDERWQGVFLAKTLDASQSEITVADWGEVRTDEAGERVGLELHNAVTHTVDLSEPGRYHRQRSQDLEVILEESFTSSRRESTKPSKGLRSMTLPELRAKIDDPDSPAEMRNLALVEVHKKFAIPAACVVFGLFALPLGFSNRRGSRASGFALSIGVILVYYLLLNNGEEAARYGKITPWIGMWFPNVLLTLVGLFLLTRKNQDKSLLLSRIDRWIRQDLWAGLLRLGRWRDARRDRRKALREADDSSEPSGDAQQAAVEDASERPRRRFRLQVPRPRLRFPNLLDRYVLRVFVGILALVMLSGITLYVVGDLTEKVDEVLENDVGKGLLLRYYQYFSLQIFYELSPIVVLITTLITYSLLSKTNEITAGKASGVSLYRLSVPALIGGLFIAGFCAYLQYEVLPVTNQRAGQLEDQIKGRESQRTYSRADRQWIFGRAGHVYHYLHYDRDAQRLQRLQVFEFDENHRLVSRLAAARATYDPELAQGAGGWVFEDGWARSFDPSSGEPEYRTFDEPTVVDFPETPEYFDSEIRPPEMMRYPELKSYIAELEHSGQKVPELEVALHNKIASPVVSLVMVLVALPFAFRLGRQGTLVGVGVSIVIGMIFFAVLALFTALGTAGVLPALVAVWSPSVIFSTLSAYLFLGVRT